MSVARAVAVSAAAACLTLGNRQAAAFSVAGHEVIEASAYRALLARRAIDDGRNGTAPGIEVARYLIRHGVLQKPPCFEPTSEREARDCAERNQEYPAGGWFVVGSGAPDLMTSRQFSTNGQCFHFMSSSEEVWDSEPDPRLGVPSGLIHDAYQRCTRTLGAILADIVHRPEAANRRYRGFYALVHAVTDSFSAAHVERDARGRILFLKPWSLRAFLPYTLPTRWNAWKYFGPHVHHGPTDARDDDFLIDSQTCRDRSKHPYAVPESCLSPRGKQATAAVVDLMELLYRVLHRRRPEARPREEEPDDDDDDGDAPRALRSPDLEAEWRVFISRHLASAIEAPDLRVPFPSEREWSPEFVAGFRFRNEARPGSTDLGLLFGTTLVSNITLPIIPFVSAEVGCRRIGGECETYLGIDPLTTMLPITEGLQIGATPVSVIAQLTGDDRKVSVGANVARADVYLIDALWLSISGPRYSWVHQRLEGELYALSVGTAWSGRTSVIGRFPLLGEPAAKGVDALRKRVDVREVDDPDEVPVGPAWRPPRLRDDYRLKSWTNVIDVASGTLVPEGGAGDYGLGGYAIFWDRDRLNRRAGFAFGARIDASFHVVDEDKYFGPLLGPALRFYVFPDLLALEARPLLFSAGYRRNAGESSAFWDASAQGDVVFLPLNHLELSVSSPRFSYRALERIEGTNVALRIGFAIEKE
jgi:hypothetical protein